MNKKPLIIIIVVVCIVGLLFAFKTKDKKLTDGSIAKSETSPESLDSQFLGVLLSLNTLKLDTSIFSSPVFNSLNPSGAVINTNPDMGRSDPFLPAGVSTTQEPIISTQNTLSKEDTPLPNTTLESSIEVNRITSTTAFVTLAGFPKDSLITLTLVDPNGLSTNYRELTYKTQTGEYTRALTGLLPKTAYNLKAEDSSKSLSAVANFITK